MASLLSLDEPVLAAVVAALSSDFLALARVSCVCRRLRAHAHAAQASLRSLDVSPLGRRAAGALRLAGARCGALEALSCCEAGPVTDADVAAAVRGSATTLRRLSLLGLRHLSNDLGAALCAAGPLRALEALELRGCRALSDAFLAAILLRPDSLPAAQAAQPRLARLDLADTAVSDGSVALLSRLPALRDVDLSWSPVVDGVRFLTAGGSGAAAQRDAVANSVTSHGIISWALCRSLPQDARLPLRSLRLAYRRRLDVSVLVGVLSLRCPQLEELDFNHTRVHAPLLITVICQIAQDSFAPRLTMLNLAATESLGDEDVANLARHCGALEELDLSLHDDLGDAALRSLAALPRLRTLTLVRSARITPAGLRALLEAPGAPLRRLRCVRCRRVGVTALQVLAAQHPHCTIEWE